MPAIDSSPASASCPCCGATRWHLRLAAPVDYEYGVQPERAFRFIECDACGTDWLDPRPSEEELVAFYPSGYHAYHDDHGMIASLLVKLRARVRARYYRRLVPSGGGHLFDVGAGDCRHFVELAGRTGLTFAGVEINPDMAARARSQHYDVETGTLERMDLTRHLGRYDIVSMNHVLEHVSDPREVLRRTHTMLKPGGWVVGQLPTKSSWEYHVFGGRWAGYHYPRHLQIFTREGLVRLLGSNGFDQVRLRSTPHAQIALSSQNTLIHSGVRTRLQFGRAPYFGALLCVSLPFEILASACNQSGVIDFEARRQ